jgi:hypothetical protein
MANPPGTCGICIFWDAAEPVEPKYGRCRARPPVTLTTQGHAAWPQTAADDWCGLFTSTALEAQRS